METLLSFCKPPVMVLSPWSPRGPLPPPWPAGQTGVMWVSLYLCSLPDSPFFKKGLYFLQKQGIVKNRHSTLAPKCAKGLGKFLYHFNSCFLKHILGNMELEILLLCSGPHNLPLLKSYPPNFAS